MWAGDIGYCCKQSDWLGGSYQWCMSSMSPRRQPFRVIFLTTPMSLRRKGCLRKSRQLLCLDPHYHHWKPRWFYINLCGNWLHSGIRLVINSRNTNSLWESNIVSRSQQHPQHCLRPSIASSPSIYPAMVSCGAFAKGRIYPHNHCGPSCGSSRHLSNFKKKKMSTH